MSERRLNERKVVGKNVAVALGITCVVLAAGLAGSITVFYLENADLHNQVDNLNAVINGEKTVDEIWLTNKTYTLYPNSSTSEWFITPHSGSLKVECWIEPANPDVWVNATWSVYYYPGVLYQVYPTPFIHNHNPSYIEEEFPVVSFGRIPTVPNVGVAIGNNSTETVTLVNVTITMYY